MRIFFVRHGKDDDRYRGGWSNRDLIPEGIEQSKKLAEHITENALKYNIDHIISSDLPRTMTTADFVSALSGLAVVKEPRIREINNGDLSGMPNDKAKILYPGLFFSSLDMDERYPSGESPREFYIRIRTWFEEFIGEHRNDRSNVLVVTHSGVINIIYHIVVDIEWSNKCRPFAASNCGIHLLNTETMKFEIKNKVDFLDDCCI